MTTAIDKRKADEAIDGSELGMATPLQAGSGTSKFNLVAFLGPGLLVCLADTDAACLLVACQSGAQWGYSLNKLGATSWESPDGNNIQSSGASPETEKAIDDEVRAIVDVAYKTCKETLQSNWPLMEDLTERLMEKENVDFVELYEMVGKYNPEMAEAAKKNMPPEVLANMTSFKDAESVEMKVPEAA